MRITNKEDQIKQKHHAALWQPIGVANPQATLYGPIVGTKNYRLDEKNYITEEYLNMTSFYFLHVSTVFCKCNYFRF